MLMPYFVRYRLSKRFNLSHGNASHAKQDLALPSSKVAQFLILQSRQEGGFPSSGPRQPGHLFLCLRKATQMAQFIPQGAISELLCVDTITFHTAACPYRCRYSTTRGSPIPPGTGARVC